MKTSQTKHSWIYICISLDSSTLLTCVQLWTNEVTLQLKTLQLKCFHIPATKKNPNPLLFIHYCSTKLLNSFCSPSTLPKREKNPDLCPWACTDQICYNKISQGDDFQMHPTQGNIYFHFLESERVFFFLSLSSFPSARTQREPEHI